MEKEEVKINIDNAANIDVPDTIIIDGDNMENYKIASLEAVLKKLSKIKAYKLNHKCYCYIKSHGLYLLGDILKNIYRKK